MGFGACSNQKVGAGNYFFTILSGYPHASVVDKGGPALHQGDAPLLRLGAGKGFDLTPHLVLLFLGCLNYGVTYLVVVYRQGPGPVAAEKQYQMRSQIETFARTKPEGGHHPD